MDEETLFEYLHKVYSECKKGHEKNEVRRKQYVLAMHECNSGDVEVDHCSADDLLCDLLLELGFDDVVAEYEEIKKWCS